MLFWFCSCACRCMGWLIRFIHNRDLAAENIITAYTRQCVLLSFPPHFLAELHCKLEETDVKLPARSLLKMIADYHLHIDGVRPGSYNQRIKPSRRNSKKAPVPEEIKQQIKRLCATRSLGTPAFSSAVEQGVSRMTSGVYLNGRMYSRGDDVELSTHVPRQQPNLAGEPTTMRMARIDHFYVVPCGHEGARVVFVAVILFESGGPMVRSLHVRIRAHVAAALTQQALTVVHVDSIQRKLHFVPHHNCDELEYGIPVWQAK